MESEPLFKSRIKHSWVVFCECLVCDTRGAHPLWYEVLRGPVCGHCTSALDNAQHALQEAGCRVPVHTFLRRDVFPDCEVVA